MLDLVSALAAAGSEEVFTPVCFHASHEPTYGWHQWMRRPQNCVLRSVSMPVRRAYAAAWSAVQGPPHRPTRTGTSLSGLHGLAR